MYSDKSYFILWVTMKLEHILGLLKKEKGNLFDFFILNRKTIHLELR